MKLKERLGANGCRDLEHFKELYLLAYDDVEKICLTNLVAFFDELKCWTNNGYAVTFRRGGSISISDGIDELFIITRKKEGGDKVAEVSTL